MDFGQLGAFDGWVLPKVHCRGIYSNDLFDLTGSMTTIPEPNQAQKNKTSISRGNRFHYGFRMPYISNCVNVQFRPQFHRGYIFTRYQTLPTIGDSR